MEGGRKAEERYHSTMGEGEEQDALSTCGELPTEDKVGSGEEPSTRIPETPVVEPVCRHETGEKEGADEESWHDANEEGWETACEEVKHGGGTGRSTFRFGWSRIRSWIVRSGLNSA